MAETTDSYAANWPQSSTRCPSCHTAISYYDMRGSKYFGCSQCGTFFSTESGSASVLRTFAEEERRVPDIPLGTWANLQGKAHVLVGHAYKEDPEEGARWNEYTFFNDTEEWYVTLAEYNGHWMMITRSEEQFFNVFNSSYGSDAVTHDGNTYYQFLNYSFRVLSAVGEFDGDLLADEQLTTYEFVAAPYLLINERKDGYDSWFKGVYMSPSAIMGVMDIDRSQFPPRRWPAPFVPAKFYADWKPLMIFSGILLAAFILLTIADSMLKPEKVVYSNNFISQADSASWGNSRPVVSEPFQIQGPTPVIVSLSSGAVDNSWLELPVTMVNEKTGQAYEVEKTIEYYHGYDDGNWSEGNQQVSFMLGGIPSGSYRLNIFPQTEYNIPGGIPFSVSVAQHTFIERNFWWMLLLIITWPVIQMIRKYKFEKSRWFDKEYGKLEGS